MTLSCCKKFSALLRGITGNNNGDFYCLICFCLYTIENKPKKHKNVCENHDYCYVQMPEKDNKILKYNQGEKFMKFPFTIYANVELVLEKMNTCHNNPKKASTTKMHKHTPCGYSLFTHCSFDTTKNKFDYYRGKNCMKNFCPDVREHATKIINYEKKEMIPLTKNKRKCIISEKFAIYVKKRFSTEDGKKSILK